MKSKVGRTCVFASLISTAPKEHWTHVFRNPYILTFYPGVPHNGATMNRLISTFVLGVLLLGAWPARAQEDPNCAGAPMPRLSVGAQARVLPGDANNVRDSASRSGALVGSIPGGGVFTVLEGPVCADGFNWWGVEYN